MKFGGARVVPATVTNGPALTATLGAPHEPLEGDGLVLLGGRRAVTGWYSGNSIEMLVVSVSSPACVR